MAVDPKVLQDFIEESGIRHKTNGVSFIFTCPRCSKLEKLYIRRTDGRFVCWYCKETAGFEGRAEYALAELLGLPIQEVTRRLYGAQAIRNSPILDLCIEEDDSDLLQEPDSMEATCWPPDFYPLGDARAIAGVKYLASRGISVEIATEYGVRYHPADRRVVFPIERGGNLYGWQARSIVDATPKILSQSGMNRTIMFADRLIGSSHCVLTEGPVDCIKAHLCGGNVATMGKAVSFLQMAQIRSYGVQKLYLALDPDAADETSRLVRDNSDLEVYVMEVPERQGIKNDLGAMDMEEVLGLFRAAVKVNGSRLFVFLG